MGMGDWVGGGGGREGFGLGWWGVFCGMSSVFVLSMYFLILFACSNVVEGGVVWGTSGIGCTWNRASEL